MDSGELSLTANNTHPGLRFIRFSNWLQAFKSVNEIFYELVPRFESAAAARVHCGLLAIVQMFAATHNIRLGTIKPNQVKMGFVGNGACKKVEVCRVAHKLGWEGGHPNTEINHNEADAIACAWVLMQQRGYEIELAENHHKRA